MICKLCNQEKKLIESHLIPRWAFTYLRPSKEVKQKPLIIVHTQRDKKTNTGLYDPKILCKECDTFLGKYDRYGKQVLLEKVVEEQSPLVYLIRNVDITVLCIFLLSVLWRCSISTKEEVETISLGYYEKKILDILSKVKAKQDVKIELEEFPMIFSKFSSGNYPELVDKNMQLPIPVSIGYPSVDFIALYFPRGFKIYVKNDNKPLPTDLLKVQIRGSDVLVLNHGDFENSYEFHFMKKAVNKK